MRQTDPPPLNAGEPVVSLSGAAKCAAVTKTAAAHFAGPGRRRILPSVGSPGAFPVSLSGERWSRPDLAFVNTLAHSASAVYHSPMSKQYISVNVRVGAELIEKLDEIGEALGLGRSEIVRRAMSVYVAQAQPVIEDLKAGRGGLWSYLFGPPVRATGDETDEQMLVALNALAREMKRTRGQSPKGATA